MAGGLQAGTGGAYELKARATNMAGETQPLEALNPAGYMRNVVETLRVTAA